MENLRTPALAPQTAEQTSEQATAAALSRLDTLGFSVTMTTKTTFRTCPKTGADLGFQTVPVGVTVTTAEGADPLQAQEIIGQMLAPASPREIGQWLVELSTITARRAADEADATITLATYTRNLLAFPGDIVRETLRGWRGKWWPTWAEMADVLEPLTAMRRAIAAEFGVDYRRALPSPETRAGAAIARIREVYGPVKAAAWLDDARAEDSRILVPSLFLAERIGREFGPVLDEFEIRVEVG